jgi:hypothetical protein
LQNDEKKIEKKKQKLKKKRRNKMPALGHLYDAYALIVGRSTFTK